MGAVRVERVNGAISANKFCAVARTSSSFHFVREDELHRILRFRAACCSLPPRAISRLHRRCVSGSLQVGRRAKCVLSVEFQQGDRGWVLGTRGAQATVAVRTALEQP